MLGILTTCLLVLGCTAEKQDIGQLQGAITVDGQPVENGSITFTPLSGQSPSTGGKIVGGRYEADVPLGESRVAINVVKVVGEEKAYNMPGARTIPIVKEVLPAKYNTATELTVKVTPGENECNFDLSSK
ncbi:MAG: hypothetical protein KDA37_04485 [Planctomycetales bacterium]|nr:hypothetical protein [Planctomycetales bacterium]